MAAVVVGEVVVAVVAVGADAKAISFPRRLQMNCRRSSPENKHFLVESFLPVRKHGIVLAVVLLATTTLPAIAQNGELQQKLAAVKQAAAENKQQLHQYQWIETTQLTLKGDAKPSSQQLCQYGPDGQIQKTPIGAPQQPSGGRMKQRVIAKKKAEIQGLYGRREGRPQLCTCRLTLKKCSKHFRLEKCH